MIQFSMAKSYNNCYDFVSKYMLENFNFYLPYFSVKTLDEVKFLAKKYGFSITNLPKRGSLIVIEVGKLLHFGVFEDDKYFLHYSNKRVKRKSLDSIKRKSLRYIVISKENS